MNSVGLGFSEESVSFKKLRIQGLTWIFYWINFGLFFILKLWFRPWIREQEGFEMLKIISNSFPNFVEAYIGVFTVSSLLMLSKSKGFRWTIPLKDRAIYLIATLFSALFVITQEMKIHNLGGENIYDFNDIIASVIGLIFIFMMLNLYGVKLVKK
ncbi:MAG: hypothetical protein ROO71_02910 [Balneola sp.]